MFRIEIQNQDHSTTPGGFVPTRADVNEWVVRQDQLLEVWLDNMDSGRPTDLLINEGSHVVVHDTETNQSWNIVDTDNWEPLNQS